VSRSNLVNKVRLEQVCVDQIIHFCDKFARPLKVTKKEKEAMIQIINGLKEEVTTIHRPGSVMHRKLKKAPHQLIDNLTGYLFTALYKMPHFITQAVQMMLRPNNRKKIPDPHKRYEAIKEKFLERVKEVNTLPLAYEYIVMRICVLVG